MSVTGKSCIVTGAANGVGLAIARRFAEDGAHVMLADMDENNLQTATDQLKDAGHDVQSFSGDLRQKLTIANLISATKDAFERVDVLVNGSRQVDYDPGDDFCPEMLSTLIEQNVGSNLRLTRAVVKVLTKQAEREGKSGNIGAIVNLTSIAANRTLPRLAAFSVSCAALDQLTRSLAVTLADRGIRVNAVAIGSVMSASLRQTIAERDGLRDLIVQATPLGRIGEAEEAAEAALFLASDHASFVTGQILTVDGGRSLLDPLAFPAH